jgi:phage-related protein
MKDKCLREILYYEDYYLYFFNELKPEVRIKFNWTLNLISTIEKVPSKYLLYITNSSGIYEIRVEIGTYIYRVFCFFDKGNLIILLNGFQKKSQKTPKRK